MSVQEVIRIFYSTYPISFLYFIVLCGVENNNPWLKKTVHLEDTYSMYWKTLDPDKS